MSLPSGIMPWVESRFLDANGVPLAGGTVTTYATGTTTPKATYTDTARTAAHTNPIVLDAAGRPPTTVYLTSGGYTFLVKDVNGVQQYTWNDIEDVGQTWLATWGTTLASGARSVTSGYTVVEADSLITVLSTGGADPCLINLPAAVSRTTPVVVKNMGTVHIHVVPNGTEKIDGLSVITVPVASTPDFPAVWLTSDGTAWHILASHALATSAPGTAAPDLSYVLLADSTAALALTNNTLTALSWDTEVEDDDALHASGLPTRVLTVPTSVSGIYHVAAQVHFVCDNWPATRRHWIGLRVNGSSGNLIAKTDVPYIGNNLDDVVLQVTADTLLAEDDYVEVVVYSSVTASPAPAVTIKGNGTSANYYTWVSVTQVIEL